MDRCKICLPDICVVGRCTVELHSHRKATRDLINHAWNVSAGDFELVDMWHGTKLNYSREVHFMLSVFSLGKHVICCVPLPGNMCNCIHSKRPVLQWFFVPLRNFTMAAWHANSCTSRLTFALLLQREWFSRQWWTLVKLCLPSPKMPLRWRLRCRGNSNCSMACDHLRSIFTHLFMSRVDAVNWKILTDRLFHRGSEEALLLESFEVTYFLCRRKVPNLFLAKGCGLKTYEIIDLERRRSMKQLSLSWRILLTQENKMHNTAFWPEWKTVLSKDKSGFDSKSEQTTQNNVPLKVKHWARNKVTSDVPGERQNTRELALQWGDELIRCPKWLQFIGTQGSWTSTRPLVPCATSWMNFHHHHHQGIYPPLRVRRVPLQTSTTWISPPFLRHPTSMHRMALPLWPNFCRNGAERSLCVHFHSKAFWNEDVVAAIKNTVDFALKWHGPAIVFY